MVFRNPALIRAGLQKPLSESKQDKSSSDWRRISEKAFSKLEKDVFPLKFHRFNGCGLARPQGLTGALGDATQSFQTKRPKSKVSFWWFRGTGTEARQAPEKRVTQDDRVRGAPIDQMLVGACVTKQRLIGCFSRG